jgi:hypothetical protein
MEQAERKKLTISNGMIRMARRMFLVHLGLNIHSETIFPNNPARILYENAEFWGNFSESVCSMGRKA